MPEVWLIKYQGRIVTADDDSHRALRAMPNGQAFKATVKGERCHKQHRLWHALANIVAESSAVSQNPDQIKRLWLARAGYCTEYIDKESGRIWMVADSTAIHEMEQHKFDDLFRSTLQWISEAFLPNCDEADILERIAELTGRSKAA